MSKSQHIFRVGDKVKVVKSGWGMAPEDVNKITTITSLQGHFFGGEPLYGVDKNPLSYAKYQEEKHMAINEQSFVLVEPTRQMNIDPYSKINFSVGHMSGSIDLIQDAKLLINGERLSFGVWDNSLNYPNLPVLYVSHIGEGKIDIIDGMNWDSFKREHNMNTDPLWMQSLKSAIKTILEDAIKEQHAPKWPITFGNVQVYNSGSVYSNGNYVGTFINERPEEGNSMLFSPEIDEKYALMSESLGNIKKALEEFNELKKKKLWIKK